MKFNQLDLGLMLYFEAISASYPPNINQTQGFDNRNKKFARCSANQQVETFDALHTCFGNKCNKVSKVIDKLTYTLSSSIQVKNSINIKVDYISYCEILNVCNLANEKILGK
jgi:hypothetical protein